MQKQSGLIRRIPDRVWGAGFLLLLGLIGLGWSSARLTQGWLNQNWPTTEGVITESRILTGYDSEGNASHQVKISYSYVVDDVIYIGNRLSAAGNFSASNRQAAEDVLLQYWRGTAVTVAYDPRNPARAVLETGPQSGSWLGVIISGVVAIIGTSGLWLALRTHRQNAGV